MYTTSFSTRTCAIWPFVISRKCVQCNLSLFYYQSVYIENMFCKCLIFDNFETIHWCVSERPRPFLKMNHEHGYNSNV